MPDNNDNEPPHLSEIGNNKIKKMINKEIRKEKNKRIVKRLPRIAAAILIVLVVSSIAVMSVDALRVKFLNLFVETNEIVTDITIEDGLAEDSGVKVANMPTYIPDGYELLTSSEELSDQTTQVYTNQKGENIIIYKYDVDYKIGVDTEDSEYGEIVINGKKGFYSIKGEFTTLVFKTDEYAYSILASIDISEIQKIANSIK